MGLSKEQTEAVVAEFTPTSAMISPFLFYHEAPEHSVKIFSQLLYMRTTCRFKTPKLERGAGAGFRCAK